MRYADEGVFLRCFLSGYLIEGFIDLLVAFVFYFCLTLSFGVCLHNKSNVLLVLLSALSFVCVMQTKEFF